MTDNSRGNSEITISDVSKAMLKLDEELAILEREQIRLCKEQFDIWRKTETIRQYMKELLVTAGEVLP